MVNGFKTVLTKTDPNHPSKRVREKAAISGHLILGRCEQCLSPKYRVTAIESPTRAPKRRFPYSIHAKTILNFAGKVQYCFSMD